ncbi:MAG: V-type ATPase subunit [Armatimonadetes bacterium]|nr:V-type ATPase subunit [Armatimonadota bacterium]
MIGTREQPVWGFVCGRISVLEGRLKGRELLLSLLSVENPEELIPQLQDTILGECLEPGAAGLDFHTLTERCLYDHILSIRADSPGPLPADLFLLHWDYLNLKNALLGTAPAGFSGGLVSQELIQEAARGDLSDLPAPMAEGAALAREHSDNDPALVDVILDGAYLRHLLLLAPVLRAPITEECTRGRVRAQAIGVLWRAIREKRPLGVYARCFLPVGPFTPILSELLDNPTPENWPALVGGVYGDLLAEALELPPDEQVAGFGLRAADLEVERSREARLQTSTPDRVYAYLAAVTAEMQNLKLVVSGRMSRMEPAILRQRMRES